MTEKSKKLQGNFVKTFSPSAYTELHRSDFQWAHHFYLKNIHDVLSSGVFKGTDCLEVGCGPTVHSLASASRYYDRLVASDYTESNRKEVEKWLRHELSAVDGTAPFLEFVATLEGFRDPTEGRKEVEARIRDKLKSVVFCDVLDPNLFPPEVPRQYDVIISSLCLEAACPDVASFKDALRNMAALQRSGGGIILMGVTGCPSWIVGENAYFCIPLDRQLVEGGLREAGYRVLDWKHLDAAALRSPGDKVVYDGVFFVVASRC